MKTCQFLAAFSFFLYSNWCNNRIICAMSAPNRPKSMNTRGREEHTKKHLMYWTVYPLHPLLHPPSPAPLRFVRGYVMVRLTSLTLPVYFVNINGACPPSTLYTPHSSLLTHTHTHAHLHSLFPSLPLSPSPSFSFCLSLTHTHRTKCCWMATFDVVAGVALTLPSGGYTRCHTLTHTHTHGHTHTPTHRAVAGSRLIDWF